MPNEPNKTPSEPELLPAEVLVPELPPVITPPTSAPTQGIAPAPPPPRLAAFSKGRLAAAFAIAAASDLLFVWLSVAGAFLPPVAWAVDFTTALLLFAVLGWQWMLLPGLILEAIPGVYVLPFWVLVVAAVAVWGTARPKLN